MVVSKVREIILRFIGALNQKGIQVERALLFGSNAYGNPRADSDLDVAIVSPDFGKDRFEEGKMLFQVAWRIDPRIEPVPISSRAFENDTWVPIIHEIRQKGVEIEF